MMEQVLPPLPSNYPWLLALNPEPEDDKGEHIFYTLHKPMVQYRCRIPELVGKHVRACFHGWMILSNHPHHIHWSLWNPVTSNFITLPPLILRDGDSDDIRHCCLTSPPGDPGSLLLLTRVMKPNIVFCRLDPKANRLIWIDMSYSEQLTSINADPHSFLEDTTCCNGKVYAQAIAGYSAHLIQIDIAVKENRVVISLSPTVDLPYPDTSSNQMSIWLEGSSAELFAIVLGFTKKKPVDAYLYKLDMSSKVWIKMKDLKNTVMFLNMEGHDSVYSNPAMDSKLSGYIHFLNETGKVMYSYDVKDKTISMSSMRCLDLPPRLEAFSMTVWGMPEFRFGGDDEEGDLKQAEGKGDEIMVIRSATATTKNDYGHDEVVQTSASRLLNLPFDVLKMIMEFCVGIEYLNFRATCKLCRLEAPMIQWSKERMRLQTYSLVSPWLMTLDKDGGIMTFRDPMFGEDKYLIKAPPELFDDGTILCSRYGWLLSYMEDRWLAFFNPFTNDIRKLLQAPNPEVSYCFSAPPTSPDCMVVGISQSCPWSVYVHFVAGEAHWRTFHLDLDGDDSNSFAFPTCCGRDVYAMHKDGGLHAFREIGDVDKFSWERVAEEIGGDPESPKAEYFQSKCDGHHLQVVVGEFGESVEVFELSECTGEWEEIDSLGRHMIYISDRTCVCMDATTPEMENKIYFPRFNCDNGKMVFYSMETRRYHTFNGRNIEESNVRDLFGTKRPMLYTETWIEPTWC